MPIRRLRRHPVELDVTAFINLIVVLVPFLLSTTVFSRLAVLEMSLPAGGAAIEKLTGELQLEVVIRKDTLEIGDRIGGLIQRLPAKAEGGHDLKSLTHLMENIKQRFPDKNAVTLLAEQDTPYEVLVQVMDAVRVGQQVQGAKVVKVELFPEISIGDAPQRVATAGGKG